MKRLTSLFGLLTLSLILFGCTSGTTLSTIEFNNEVVDILNETSAAIEDTTTTYDESVPNIVTEEAIVDTAAMQTFYDDAMDKAEAARNVLNLKSRNQDQETAVKAEFETYLELSDSYLTTYGEMIEYYQSGSFAENLDSVATYDEELHLGYNDFIESNNSLVDILAGFID